MCKKEKVAELAFVCAVSLISLSLLVNLALVVLGVVPYNTADLGSSETAVPYTGRFLPAYQNLFEKGRVAVTNVANRQFPGYVGLLEAERGAAGLLDKGLYELALGGKYELLPARAADNETIYIHRDEDYLVRILTYKNADKLVRSSMELVNSAAARNPGTSFGFYIVPSPSDNGVLSKYEPLLGDMPDYTVVALGLLSPDIAGGQLEYDDMDGFREYFFNSDHHWNYTGAYRGYRDILELMRQKNPDIGRPLAAGERRVLDPDFRGSLSRRTATDSVRDELYDFSIELPPHSAGFMESDMSVREYDTAFPNRQAFLSGETWRYKYMNTYAVLFRNDYPMVTYDFGGSTGRSLLLLGDSATNCMESLLASHYDRTYSVDLRFYKSFRLDAFIEERGVTDVVFLYTSPALYTIGSGFRAMLEG